MRRLYYLKRKNDIFGIVDLGTLTFVKHPDWKKPLPLGFAPYGVDNNWRPSKQRLISFLKDRVIDENNQSLDEVLKEFNLPVYNLEVLINNTLGMKYEDFFWVVEKKYKDLDFDKFHVRGKFYNCDMESVKNVKRYV